MEAQIFDIVGLAPDNCAAPTGMRDEIILLSWLIVLMRTQESSSVRFEWRYQGSGDVPGDGDAVRTLTPSEVMLGLQSHVGQVAATLAGTVPSITEAQELAFARRPSLLISNGSLSESSEDATDEVSLMQMDHQTTIADRFSRASFIWSYDKLMADSASNLSSARTIYHNGRCHD
jgi:hypothetical protein